MKSKAYLIKHARVVEPTRIATKDIRIDQGRITALGRGLSAPAHCPTLDAEGLWALPGFIDIHCHGGGLFDVTLGRYVLGEGRFDNSPSGFERGVRKFLALAAGHGTTTILLATSAVDLGQIRRSLGQLAPYVRSDRNGQEGSRVLGFFLEGTFIKHPEFAGAQNPKYFHTPSRKLFDDLNVAALGLLRYVNIVPEHGQKGLDLIRYVSKQGVLVGAGHTECTADEYRCAADCGLKVAIHLTNGPTGGSYKPFGGGGAMEAILTSRRVVAEVITDGYHVNPAYVMDIIERKGYDRIVVVTDGMFASDAQGVGEFTRTGIRGRVSDDGRYLQVAGKKDTLFGSVLTMDAAFANVVSWYTAGLNGIWTRRHRPLDLEPAVLRTSRMMSRNPAELLGIFRAKTDAAGVHAGTGSIEVVKRADIVLARLTGKPGSYRLDVRHTFVGGKKL